MYFLYFYWNINFISKEIRGRILKPKVKRNKEYYITFPVSPKLIGQKVYLIFLTFIKFWNADLNMKKITCSIPRSENILAIKENLMTNNNRIVFSKIFKNIMLSIYTGSIRMLLLTWFTCIGALVVAWPPWVQNADTPKTWKLVCAASSLITEYDNVL